MRRLFLLAVLLFAPLCGWTADALPHAAAHADCTGHPTVQGTSSQSGPAFSTVATFTVASAPTRALATQQASASAPQGKHCTACATCLSVALPAIELRVGVQAMRHSLPRAEFTAYRSADLATGHKPPIS